MFCQNCGKELLEEVKFCPNCGKSTEEEYFITPPTQSTEIVERENKFAYLGNLFGTIALILCWIMPIAISLAQAGIALSIVGMCLKNKYPKNSEIAKKGLIKSIIAFALSIILIFIIYGIIMVCAFLFSDVPMNTAFLNLAF